MTGVAPPRRGTLPARALLLLGLGLLVWGARLAVIDRFGSDLPYLDQWAAEGEQAILPYYRHELRPLDLFAAHNEHRVALTRTLALALTVANGGWDARLECVVNAALAAALAVALHALLAPHLGPGWRAGWLAALALLFAAPIAWNNLVAGFHSQQLFLVGFSVLALAGLVGGRPGAAGWWLGLTCAGLALFSMATGLLAAFTAAATGLLTRSTAAGRGRRVTIVAAALVGAAGVFLYAPAPVNAGLHAPSVAAFLGAWWAQLQWPVRFFALFPLLAWLPWSALGWRFLRRPQATSAAERVVFAVGLWVILQYAATAYGRGADLAWPTSRYLETTAAGLLANLAALALHWPRLPATGRLRSGVAGTAVLGVILTAVGLGYRIMDNVTVDLPAHRTQMRAFEHTTRTFLETGSLAGVDPAAIPDQDAATFARRLRAPELQAVLPPSVQPGRTLPPLSRLAAALAGAGPALAALGLVLILFGARRALTPA